MKESIHEQKEQQGQTQKEKESSSVPKQNQTEIDELQSTVLSLQDKYEELESTLHEANNDITAMRN